MNAGLNIKGLRKKHGHLLRGLAIFFLIFTGVDLAFPQFCNEEAGIPFVESRAEVRQTIRSSEASATATAITSPDTSSPEQQSPETHDEHCFCCCAHILPSPIILSVAVSDLSSPASTLEKASVKSPSLRGTFHPPRFA